MNERLEEFAKQSGIGLFKDNSFGWSVLAGTDSHLQKFAELIVRECAGIAHSNADVDETYDYACHTIAWKIKEHFGVEE